MDIAQTPANSVGKAPDGDARLLKAAQKLEASFLAEMLKAAGYGEARDSSGAAPARHSLRPFSWMRRLNRW